MFQKPKRPVDRVFIHCSASDKPVHGALLKSMILAWHTDPKPRGNGWSNIGYHYLIDKKGVEIPCRPLEKQPAAQYPFNRGTIAVCVHGLDVDKFSTQSLDALRRLCADINEAYEGRISFHGHREVNEHKTCPVFDYEAVLNLDRFGRMP